MAREPAIPAARRARIWSAATAAQLHSLREAETERLSEAVLNRTALSRLSQLGSYQTQ